MKTPWISMSFLCLACFPGAAEQSQSPAPIDSKPAWQWKDEERFAARFAPGSATERLVMLSELPGHRYSGSRQPEPHFRDVVSGHRDPQLLFPLEVFTHLVRLVIRPGQPAPSAEEQRFVDDLLAQVSPSHLPPDFRAILERETASYRELQTQYQAETADLRARRPSRGDKEIDDKLRATFKNSSREACRAIYKALAGVRRELGTEGSQSLLEFLYKEIAPRMTILFESDEQSHEAEVRDFVGGCP